MIIFKSCPRCTGDRTLERDYYGWYLMCLACGHVTYPDAKRAEALEKRYARAASKSA